MFIKNKPKILIDAEIFKNGFKNNANRSGIYFVAINLFGKLLNNNKTEVALYCRAKDIPAFKKLFQKENIKNIKYYTFDKECFPLCNEYNLYRNKKIKARDDKKIFKKLYYQLVLAIMNPFYHHYKKLYSKNKFFEYNTFLSPVFKIPQEIKECKNIKNYTLLYDVIPLVLKNKIYQHSASSWFLNLINSLNKDDYYLCISEYTRQDFLKHCPEMDKNKTYTCYIACNERFKPQDKETIEKVKQKFGLENKNYIFSIGNLEPRKNLIRIVRSFAKFLEKNKIDDLYLVISGTNWDSYIKELDNEISSLKTYKDKIIKTGYIEDDDVPALYSGALWFVYTSQYEGFGMPPLEAMKCGCPVVTSNNTSLPEVVGDCAITVDFDVDEQHINAFETYYFNKEKREENRQKGLLRAKQFSFNKYCSKIVDIMKSNLK